MRSSRPRLPSTTRLPLWATSLRSRWRPRTADASGSEVTVRLIRPVDGVRDFTGVLTASDENGVTIQLDEENEMTFERSEAAYVRLVDNYDYASAELAEDSE